MTDNRLIFWLVLGVFFVALLNLPESLSQRVKNSVREGVAPLQEAVTGGWRAMRESVDRVRGLGGLAEENERMAGEMARLMNQLNEFRALEKENEAFRSLIGFRKRSPRELLAAEVIARDPGGWWQSLRLDRGSAVGAKAGLAVVSPEGLVGRTVEVSEQTSDVLLLSDPSSRISAQILRTGSFGILYGRGSTWRGQVICRMEFINKNADIRPGDEVITSGLGGIFPKGLLIGYVDSVEKDRSGLYQHADVLSKADLASLQHVFILRDDPSAPLYEHTNTVGEAASP